MIRRSALILGVALLAAIWLGAGAATPARASATTQMRDAVMALRGLIDREGAAHFFTYPTKSNVRAGHLDDPWWPVNPWTGRPMSAGVSRGHYRYEVSADRRRYRLIGYLNRGSIVVEGGMPRTIMLAYDHRGEEGANLIRQYVQAYAAGHDGVYPLPSEVSADGPVGSDPHRYWPSNPWDHYDMEQRGDHGSFSYEVAGDRASFTLRLHRALKPDYVLKGTTATSPWQQLLTSLEDEILRRSGRVLAGYVGQWSLQHAGTLPTVTEFTPAAGVGVVHADWPQDPSSGDAIRPGTGPGTYTYAPGIAAGYTLTVHLHSGEFQAGGTAPSPAAPGS